MDDSSLTESDTPSVTHPVASILGVKGALRFRPHGSSQKAHVVLRRVTVSDDLTEGGGTNQVVYFSLFAQKRIEVKPGKEILLTVASLDGRFKDQPVIFEGDLATTDDLSDEEESTQVAEEEEDFCVPHALPPKMRRAWTKRVEDVVPFMPPTATYNTVGIQAEPSRESAYVQAQPIQVTRSIQARPLTQSTSIEVIPPPPPPHMSSSTQTIDPRTYSSLVIQTDSPQHDASGGFKDVHTRGRSNTTEQRDRSLSPMELDSPNGSDSSGSHSVRERSHFQWPVNVSNSWSLNPSQEDSPQIDVGGTMSAMLPLSTKGPLTSNSPLMTPNSPSSSIASSSCAKVEETSQISPTISTPNHTLDTSLRCEPKTEAKSLEVNSHLTTSTPISEHSGERSATNSFHEAERPLCTVLAYKESISLAQPLLASPQPRSPGGTPTPIGTTRAVSLSAPSHPVTLRNSFTSTMQRDIPPHFKLRAQEKEREAGSRVPNPGGVGPKKAEIRNPFVSAGFITEFAGGGRRMSQVDTALQKTAEGEPKHSPPSTSATAFRAEPKPSMSKITPVQPQSFNAVASSSRVSPLPSSQLPRGPRALSEHYTSTQERSSTPTPISSAPRLGPKAMQPAARIMEDVKPTPSGSNPLNIRPSTSLSATRTPKVPPTAPKLLSQSVSKKRVVVGSTWPPPRTSNSIPVSSSTSRAASLHSHPKYTSPDLDRAPVTPGYSVRGRVVTSLDILPYSSPSPPPPPSLPPPETPPPPESPPTKWKRVASEQPTRTNPMVHAQPPPPPRPQPSLSLSIPTAQPFGKRVTPISSNPQSPAIPNVDELGRRPSASDHISRSREHTVTPTSARPLDSQDMAVLRKSDPSMSSSSLPLPPTHPLPPKPVLHSAGTPRGLKRDRSPEPYTEPSRRRRQSFRWPTVDSSITIPLKGDGDLSIRQIVFSSDGKHFALSCADRTVRIWNNRSRTEVAKLVHNGPILALSWMEGDKGVVTLGDDGIVRRCNPNGQNEWRWNVVLDAGREAKGDDGEGCCLAYMQDRIAVSFPLMGVKVWVLLKGTWQPQRSIIRQKVTALQFVEDGAALLGGTRDGVLWYCEIPNGTLRAYALLMNKIISLDVSPTKSHVLVGQIGGVARLVGLHQAKGSAMERYSCKETEARPNTGFGAVFATQGQAILFGCVEGCVLVWDRKKAAIVYGLEHGEDDIIMAVASFDGFGNKEGCLVTGTERGYISWWSQPVAAPPEPLKRQKTE